MAKAASQIVSLEGQSSIGACPLSPPWFFPFFQGERESQDNSPFRRRKGGWKGKGEVFPLCVRELSGKTGKRGLGPSCGEGQ